jgi:hypothetical protein
MLGIFWILGNSGFVGFEFFRNLLDLSFFHFGEFGDL